MNESACTAETIDGSSIAHGKSVFSYNSRYERTPHMRRVSCAPFFSAYYSNFTVCCRYLSAPCNDHVRVYSVKTGLLVHTLRRHEAVVTGIRMHPRNPQQVCCVVCMCVVCMFVCVCLYVCLLVYFIKSTYLLCTLMYSCVLLILCMFVCVCVWECTFILINCMCIQVDVVISACQHTYYIYKNVCLSSVYLLEV